MNAPSVPSKAPDSQRVETRVPATPPDRPKRPLAAIAAAAGVVLLKLKSVVGLLKIATLGKLFLSSSSMLFYMWVMAKRGGVWFGVGFVVLLLIHELGHATIIRRYKLEAGWPIFIPFFGAMIALKQRPPSREADAEISFAGPLWGTIASFAAASLYFVTDRPFWLSLGYTGLFLNMFNMTPVRPLDGGAIVEMFSRRAWIVGGLVILALFAMNPASPALIMVLLMLPRMFSRSDPNLVEPVPDAVRRTWMFRYVGLLAFMGAGMYFMRAALHAPD